MGIFNRAPPWAREVLEHVENLRWKVDQLLVLVGQQTGGKTLMATIADLNAAVLALQAQVTAGRTVEQSAETLLANLDKLYQDAVAGAPDLSSAIAAVQVVGEQVAAQSAALAAAVTANTPAAAPAPAAPAGA